MITRTITPKHKSSKHIVVDIEAVGNMRIDFTGQCLTFKGVYYKKLPAFKTAEQGLKLFTDFMNENSPAELIYKSELFLKSTCILD